jgi:hypothetical protein
MGYVEFAVHDCQRFGALEKVFTALKASKESGSFAGKDYWLSFFDKEAVSHFWWPTPAEREEWKRRWFSTPTPQRWTDPSLKRPWDFESMIDAFKNGEYELLSCDLLNGKVGRLCFDPQAHPYGGTGCMKALIESFGFEVTAEDEF